MRGFHGSLKMSHLRVHIVQMELQLFCVAGFDREDCGALELHVMIVVEPKFIFHQFVGLPKPEMLVLFLPSGLIGTTRLSTVNMTTFMEDDAVHAQRQQECLLGCSEHA